jgi:radical SAM protein with 4Fe4S-binding SPASM domain
MQEISIEITHDCALKCIFCSSSADHPSPAGELPLDSIRSILDDAVSCGAELVSISGGEPLLHEEILTILSYCRELDLNILLYSSGIVFDNRGRLISVSKSFWQLIHNSANKRITVIFDLQSCQSKNAEFLNDVKGSFGIIIDSIKNAISSDIRCEVHVVPMKQNYKEIPDILKYCKSLGISRVSFLRFVPQGRGLENFESLNLSTGEFFELQSVLYACKKSFGDDFIRLGHPIDFLFCIDKKCAINACRGGNDAPLVLPDGDVHMCPAWKQLKHLSAGNVFDKSLSEIWNHSEFYKKFRELIDNPALIEGQCKACILLPHCKGGCVAQRILLFNKTKIEFPEVMYLSPDPYCPLVNNYAMQEQFNRSRPENNRSDCAIFSLVSLMGDLHEKKSIMYGNAWKKRGEILSILSNISRKFDRIENVADKEYVVADGETVFDTLSDLCIYCVKYLTYISENGTGGLSLLLGELEINTDDIQQYCGDKGVPIFLDIIAKRISVSPEDRSASVGEYIKEIGVHYSLLEECVLHGQPTEENFYRKSKECFEIAKYCILCMLKYIQGNGQIFTNYRDSVQKLGQGGLL